MLRCIYASLIGCLIALCMVRSASAAETPVVVTHKARKGDTLPLLAAEYYGNRKFAVFIMVANEMTRPRNLAPGERLKIPTSFKVYAVAGESMKGLAGRYLDDERRATFLAEFNKLPVDVSLAEGQEVTIPFHIKHVAQSQESLKLLAATYYGNAGRAKLLREYNFRDSNRPLNAGEELTVPIVDVRIQASKMPPMDPEASNRMRRRKQTIERAEQALPAAQAAWKTGDYTRVKRELGGIDLEYLPSELAVQVGFLLGSAYVAFGDEESAAVQFKKIKAREPSFEVRADRTSPKITRLWESLGGKVVRP